MFLLTQFLLKKDLQKNDEQSKHKNLMVLADLIESLRKYNLAPTTITLDGHKNIIPSFWFIKGEQKLKVTVNLNCNVALIWTTTTEGVLDHKEFQDVKAAAKEIESIVHMF